MAQDVVVREDGMCVVSVCVCVYSFFLLSVFPAFHPSLCVSTIMVSALNGINLPSSVFVNNSICFSWRLLRLDKKEELVLVVLRLSLLHVFLRH